MTIITRNECVDRRTTIYPTITTLTKHHIEKVKEIQKFEITKACLFLTALNIQERYDLYFELLDSPIEKIPLCHLRTDMDLDELLFLKNEFNVQIFNMHSEREHPLESDYPKIKNILYIENVNEYLSQKEINKWAGICLDLSHLENDRLKKHSKFSNDWNVIKESKIGCGHISAVGELPRKNPEGRLRLDFHLYENLNNFDYLKKYKNFLHLSIPWALEVENSIAEQLKAIDYINNLI